MITDEARLLVVFQRFRVFLLCRRCQGCNIKDWYEEDLAYVHDVGYGNFALGSKKARQGLVVDLGCGSGLWA